MYIDFDDIYEKYKLNKKSDQQIIDFVINLLTDIV